MFFKIGFLKNFAKLQVCLSTHYLLRPAPLLKRDSNTGVFQRNFEEQFFYRTLPVAVSVSLTDNKVTFRIKFTKYLPLKIRPTLNVHKTFILHLGRHTNVLCTFNSVICPVGYLLLLSDQVLCL